MINIKETNQYYDKYKRNKESRTFYQSADWAKTRELALMRDRYLCVRCFKDKKIKKADLVHHIIELVDDPTLSLTLSNLESICHTCHNKHHKSSQESAEKVSNKLNVYVSKPNPNIF